MHNSTFVLPAWQRWITAAAIAFIALTVSSFVYAQCGPAAYPPAGFNPEIYNSAYSTMCNWNDPNRGRDVTITNGAAGWTGVTAMQSVALAGAITSLKLDGKEMIASGGHGAALNWAFYPNSFETASTGECYNPTLSGTQADDSQPGWNYAPYHGPSTSSIDLPLGSRAGELYSVTRMAFYIPNGLTGFGGCTASYPNRSPYNVTWSSGGNLSPFRMTQEATWRAYDVNNVLGVGATIDIEETHKPDYKLAGIVYLQPDLNTYYRFDPVAQSLQNVPLSSYTGSYPSPAGNSSVPIIASTADGSYAMGIISEPNAQGSQESHYYYLGYNDPAQNPSYPFRLNTLQVTYTGQRSTNLTAGTQLKYRVFYVFGNLDWVKYGIRRIWEWQRSY